MSDPDIHQLARRVDALEARLQEVADQQASTRHLAVNSDRDVAALQEQRRADVQLLQALRQTQLEQGRVLDEHTKVLQEHGKVLGALVAGQVAMMNHLGIEPPPGS